MGELLLKAAPELLEGWCGPVVYKHGPVTRSTVFYAGTYYDNVEPLAAYWEDDWSSVLHLDLSRPECRDHVKRLVARRRWYHDLDESTLVWFCKPVPDTAPGDDRHHRWGLESNRGTMTYQPAWAPKHEGNVPELVGLNPTDDTRLPDGSRLVDAQALLMVARKVLHG